jgi:hypothetical protein
VTLARGGLGWMLAGALAVPLAGWADTETATQKRDVPDYDGRGAEPPTPGEQALEVPRGILAPAYLVGEYLVRRPLGAATVWADQHHVPKTLYDFFTFGPDHQAGIAPVVFLDLGSNPDFGIYTFWNGVGRKGNDVRAHAEMWDTHWLAASLTDEFRSDIGELMLKGSAQRRPDHIFYGVGPQSSQANESRYGEDFLDGSFHAGLFGWRSSSLRVGFGARRESLYDGHFGADPGTAEAAAAGAFALPVGFGSAFTAAYEDLSLVVDTRPKGTSGTGARLEASVELGEQPQAVYGWGRWATTAGVFYDLNGYSRVLSLSVATTAAAPVGNAAIPFTELVSVGGNDTMRGFYVGRLVDRSGAVATLRYRWPVWMWLDGTAEAAVGNVFPSYLKGFDASLLRFSGTIGLETPQTATGAFMLLVGFGTETFAQGAKVESLRLVLGTNHGF